MFWLNAVIIGFPILTKPFFSFSNSSQAALRSSSVRFSSTYSVSHEKYEDISPFLPSQKILAYLIFQQRIVVMEFPDQLFVFL